MVRVRLVVGTEIRLRGRQAVDVGGGVPLLAWCVTRDFSSRKVLNLAPQMELLLGAKASSRYLPKRDELLLRRRAAQRRCAGNVCGAEVCGAQPRVLDGWSK